MPEIHEITIRKNAGDLVLVSILISGPLILNHYFIFLMALIRKFEVSKLFHIVVRVPPFIFYFTYHTVKMSVILIKRVNFIKNLKKHVSTDGMSSSKPMILPLCLIRIIVDVSTNMGKLFCEKHN